MPSIQEIRSASLAALAKAGVPKQHAETQISLLLEAELRGIASHGLLRLPRVIERIANGVTSATAEGHGEWRGQGLLQVDGQQGLGPVVALHALNQACERAKATGIAAAAVRNCDHLGMLAWYAEQVARRGQVLIALTVSEALVHPWGGRKAMLGTNPIAIGIPAKPEPFVFDMATSLVSMGKIHDHANRGAPIPEGWALDANGNPTTDAVAAKTGAIAPFGGAKGYALGLAFELLVTSLTGAAIGPDVKGTLDSDIPCNKGDVFIVLEPANGMASVVSRFMDEIRASDPIDPAQPVRVPGDRARRSRADRSDQNIQVTPEIWTRIRELAGDASSQVDNKEQNDAA
jgi:L-2-hydroxycarboxylate dehydrogenase (NAD+)